MIEVFTKNSAAGLELDVDLARVAVDDVVAAEIVAALVHKNVATVVADVHACGRHADSIAFGVSSGDCAHEGVLFERGGLDTQALHDTGEPRVLRSTGVRSHELFAFAMGVGYWSGRMMRQRGRCGC